jgi:hypothetical protein
MNHAFWPSGSENSLTAEGNTHASAYCVYMYARKHKNQVTSLEIETNILSKRARCAEPYADPQTHGYFPAGGGSEARQPHGDGDSDSSGGG